MDEYTPSNTLQWMEEMLTLERASFVNRIGAITAIVQEISAAIVTALSVLASATRGVLLALQLTASLVIVASVIFPRFISAAYQVSATAVAYAIDVGVSVVLAIGSSLQAVVSTNVIRKLLVSVYHVSASLSASASLLGSLVSSLAMSAEKSIVLSARRYISALSSALASIYSAVSVGSKLISVVNANSQLMNIISPMRGIVPASVAVGSLLIATLKRLTGLASSIGHSVNVSALPNARLAIGTVVGMIFGAGAQLKVIFKPAVMRRYGRAFSSMRSAMSIIVLGRRTGGHRR